MHGFMAGGEFTHATRLFEEMNRLKTVWAKVQPEGLRRSEMGTLGTVAHLECGGKRPVTISALAKAMHQSVPGISQKVSELEKQGYLKRVADQNDRRVVTVELTQQGRQATEDALQDFFSRVECALSKMGDEKCTQLVLLMGQLSDSIEQTYDVEKGGDASC